MFNILRCPKHGTFSYRRPTSRGRDERTEKPRPESVCPECVKELSVDSTMNKLLAPSSTELEWATIDVDPNSDESPIPSTKSLCCNARMTGAYGKGPFEGEILGVCDKCHQIVVRYNPEKSTLSLLTKKQAVAV